MVRKRNEEIYDAKPEVALFMLQKFMTIVGMYCLALSCWFYSGAVIRVLLQLV